MNLTSYDNNVAAILAFRSVNTFAYVLFVCCRSVVRLVICFFVCLILAFFYSFAFFFVCFLLGCLIVLEILSEFWRKTSSLVLRTLFLYSCPTQKRREKVLGTRLHFTTGSPIFQNLLLENWLLKACFFLFWGMYRMAENPPFLICTLHLH